MSFNTVILKNFFKNLKNYALYMFALVFSVVLYFSFVLMSQDDSAVEEIQSSQLMSTGFTVGSVLLVVIILAFVMFANSLFLKRRNRELALFQLIGLTHGEILRILVLENAVIYFSSLVFGIAFGFLTSRTLLMILLRLMQVELSVGLNFSVQAVIQTAILFVGIFTLLMIQNFIFLKRTRLISMLTLDQSSEADYSGMGIGTMILGLLGLIMISSGYWLSMNIIEFGSVLLLVLFGILFLTIVGTYLTFKASVAFVLNMIRKSKQGCVSVNDVLSLTSIMFKMKSNAFLLSLVSIISAISMGLISFSYISHYSVESLIESTVSHDYTFYEEEDMQFYSHLLDDSEIEHRPLVIPTISYVARGDGIISGNGDDDSEISLNIVSEEFVDDTEVDEGELVIHGLSTVVGVYMDFDLNRSITLYNDDYEVTLELVETNEDAALPSFVARGRLQAVVSSEVYSRLEENAIHDKEQAEPHEAFVIDIVGEDSQEIFQLMNGENNPLFESRIEQYTNQIQGAGILMFVIGFVGLAFLMTTGCILYFKQIGESEDEKDTYKVLRKLGFSVNEIVKGLTLKVAITFGIPLIIGLLHTYFAVNAGWFIFGNEMWIPMLTVMGAYIVLYSTFGLVSILYYKKTVRDSL
ncbi:FtsX-like permease family protein [Alkalibacterium sp. AK22]|uniref:FtsX-like permease family protein n=1 Tax=Alkalibacterium sp. AK22 TaxID=1229520 RepID=UPI0004BB0A57|nr:FtsX-like permease family protein [Alkalibacterium sp. AK22]